MFEFKMKWSFSSFFSYLLSFCLLLPVLALVISAFSPDEAIFEHLYDTVLFDYISTTLLLLLGVCTCSLVIGLPCAWLVARCDLPAKSFFSWALVLPLAMPAYVVAYVYTDLFDYAGPVQITLRQLFGWQGPQDYWFFDIRSLPGAIVILSLMLFPYVYLLLRSAFANLSETQLQASRLLGDNAWQCFFRIVLPQTRGVIIAALALVGMETLADFATVHYFAVNTLTTAVYDTWLGYYSLPAAAKISVLMLVLVFVFLSMEKYQRRHTKLFSRSDAFQQARLLTLSTTQKILALAFCSLVFFLGFLLPLLVLLSYAYDYFEQAWNEEFIRYSLQTLSIALLVAIFCIIIALVFNLIARANAEQGISRGKGSRLDMPGNLSSMGYALPGTVLAIAVLIPLTSIELQVNEWFGLWFDWQPGLFLSGSIFAIVFAYVVRFSAIGIGSIREGLAKISPNLDSASQSMGFSFFKTSIKIHLPLLKKVMFSSALLIFIESMKELPAALLLRPFGFETLATYVYQYVSDEMLEQASLAAITIVIVGLIPLIWVNRNMDRT